MKDGLNMATKAASQGRNTEGDLVRVRRALISVSDKSGLEQLVAALRQHDVEIISTGATASTIEATGAEVRAVSDVTGHPEILDGRVKTLHPRIHGGLLADTGKDSHLREMADHGIEPVQLLIVNLYPFENTITSGSNPEDCIENIDIGGPAMIRAAAKNHANVCTVTDREDYDRLIEELEATGGGTSMAFRRQMAEVAFARTAAYDSVIADWMARQSDNESPRRRKTVAGRFVQTLRYGENPHQQAAVYSDGSGHPGVLAARQLQGKELSYNNYCDLDAGLALISDFPKDEFGAACAIIKHGNPCGVACRPTALDAYRAALDCDRDSAFGGIVVVNSELTQDVAEAIAGLFTEVVSAPSVSPGAAQALASKSNLRLLEVNPTSGLGRPREALRPIVGGFLVQDSGDHSPTPDAAALKTVTDRHPSDDEVADMMFAWRVVRHVRSNAIVYCRNRATVGIGAGQMSRVDSARIAAWKAREATADRSGNSPSAGLVAASDAFLPFSDSVTQLAEAGVTALIQPGGSRRDSEVIEAANAAGIAMVFTGVRQFSH